LVLGVVVFAGLSDLQAAFAFAASFDVFWTSSSAVCLKHGKVINLVKLDGSFSDES